MKRSLLLVVGALALFASQIVLAQDGLLGKGGSKPKGGNSGSGGSKGGGGGTKPKSEPPPKGNGGGSESKSGGSRGNSGDSGKPGGLGRPDRDDEAAQPRSNRGNSGQDSLTSKGESKSGRVNYGSNNNSLGLGRPERPTNISTPPIISNDSRVVREVLGEAGRIRVNRDDYRNGYAHYDDRWCDDFFFYPHYRFQYDPYSCVPSPFYYYSNLPPYLNCVRVSIGSFSWTACTTEYRWRPVRGDYGYRDDRGGDLDYAIDDIQRAFERNSIRSLSYMIPDSGRIVVDIAGEGRYRLDGRDFYDLMRDLVEGTVTVDYRIKNAYQDRREATIVADHTYRDSWGRYETIRHTFGLEDGRRGYEIVYLKTERCGW